MKACLDEVRAHPAFRKFDHKAIISHKKYLVNNQVQLQACSLEHEMSNTTAIGFLIRK